MPGHTKGRAAIFGAGIAGLSAAHELIRLGFAVEVFEASEAPGGFFRSARRQADGGTPSEYSWHGMGPWYHNTFDVMRQIPFDETGSLYDRGLSRPIDFGLFPERGTAQFYDRGLRSIPRMFEMSGWDLARWSWLMLKTWTAHRRSEQDYSGRNAAEEWRKVLSDRSYKVWRSCFGPWIGSDWTVVSLHTAGQFFRKLLISRPSYYHPPDAEGAAWRHGGGSGWLLLRGPSSELWFDRWVRHLAPMGVNFRWKAPLRRLTGDGQRITSAQLQDGRTVEADFYILATDPFSTVGVLRNSTELPNDPELRKFEPLTQEGPHTQVSFRLSFAEPIRFPRERMAVVLADSEFNLTLFAQGQAWRPDVALGPGVKSLWTGTSCVSTIPGRIFGLPVSRCSKEQFIREVHEQILSCRSLDALVREANGGRSLRSFAILKTEVWHEWAFEPGGLRPLYPKWVTTSRNQAYRPRQATSIPNLLLAGAHTRTAADVWSIEGAVESGRRAARAIDSRVPLLEQYDPLALRLLGALDDLCFRLGAPHLLQLAGLGVAAALLRYATRSGARPSPARNGRKEKHAA